MEHHSLNPKSLESRLIKMTNHWLIRIGDGNHFNNSSIRCIWGINSRNYKKTFLSKVEEGDTLWFVKTASNGHLVAVATFVDAGPRTLTNEELGWVNTSGKWDTELYYKDLYNITHCNLFSEIKYRDTVHKYDFNCKIDLPVEYQNIVRYSKVTNSM